MIKKITRNIKVPKYEKNHKILKYQTTKINTYYFIRKL